jgi:hypothetical protein
VSLIQVPPLHAQCTRGEQGRLQLLPLLQPTRHVPDRRRHHPAPRRRRHPLLHLRRAGALQQRHEARHQGRSGPPLPQPTDRKPQGPRHLLGCLVGWWCCFASSGPQLGSCSLSWPYIRGGNQPKLFIILHVKRKIVLLW